MDRETLSNYGWMVIVLIILAIMISLATPFGSEIRKNIKDSASNMIDVTGNAFDKIMNGGGSDGATNTEPDPIPIMLEGDGQTIQKLTTTPFSFRSSARVETFKRVRVDGETVDAKNYTVAEGSTIITFTGEYGDALETGDHMVEIVSESGTAFGLLKVEVPAGLYETGTDYTILIKTWDTLVSEKSITVSNGKLTKVSESLEGDLMIDDTVTSMSTWGVIGVNDKITGLIIPDSVTEIAGACYGNTTIKRAILGSGLTAISDFAFQNCSSLESLVFYEGATSIGQQSFQKTALKSIKIPDSVTQIGSMAFNGVVSLTDVSIGNVTKAGQAFSGCSSLKSVTIREGATVIPNGIFSSCSSLESIIIPEGVTEIQTGALKACTSLKEIHLPNSLISIGNEAFNGCKSLTHIVIPENVVSIGSSFSGCTGLKSVFIPDSVTTIGDYAFNNCSALESLLVPEGVSTIGQNAFSSCKALKEITIPATVTSVGSWFLNGSVTTSKTVNYTGTKEQWKTLVADKDWCGGAIKTVKCADGDITY